MKRGQSLRGRLLGTLMLWSLLWCTVVGLAVWLAVREEVNELLDDTLQSTAVTVLGPLLRGVPGLQAPALPAALPGLDLSGLGEAGSGRFVWQVVGHPQGVVLLAAPGAPATPLHRTPSAGFADVPGWRVYGLSLGREGRMLYVAQTRAERQEALAEVGFAVLLAGLPMALLALLWLNARVRQQLRPLASLSARLAAHDALRPGATLGPAEVSELQPVHAAIDALAARLAQRVVHERAFTSHAAHALRTPLAGIDAQLAVALREAPPALQQRLQRARTAAARLQRVVEALLALFRSGVGVQRAPLALATLAAQLPVPGLQVKAEATQGLNADADLLSAALLNLLDNALRHGARTVWLSTPAPNAVQVLDDGPGLTPARRRDLQDALESQAYEGRMGLGLLLADLVARAHGGTLQLPAVPQGFAAILRLGPP